jgi:hypothetical protein
MNIKKEAAKDAAEWARAEMYFGEGAGTRRKLISATVGAKSERYPGYRAAFQRYVGRQDMAKHARLARRERRRTDTLHAINRNVKAAASGRYGGVNAVVLVAMVGGWYAHQTGYDRKVAEAARRQYQKTRDRIEKRKANANAKVHDITRGMPPHSQAR